MAKPRVVFFGMLGDFSRVALRALFAANVAVSAVVLPGARGTAPNAEPIRRFMWPAHRRGSDLLTARTTLPGSADLLPAAARGRQDAGAPKRQQAKTAQAGTPLQPLPMLASEIELDTLDLAWAHGISVFEVADLSHRETLATLTRLKPDTICVACFPRLLPPAVLSLPRLGALNLHPSLLPRYRGPFPLFWVFHDGIEHAGVTLHLMDAGADSGPIVAQTPLALPDGIGYGAAEQRCAEIGARLLIEALDGADRRGALPSRPQPASTGRYARMPRAEDFVVTADWPARRAYNFMRGLAEWHHPITLRVGSHSFTVAEALSYDADARLPEPLQRHGDVVSIRCTVGTLVVRMVTPTF